MRRIRLLALLPLLPATALAGGDNLLLIEKLASSFSADEREQAAIKLGYQPGPEVVDALVGALKKDVDPNVRAAAARSLGKVGDASALEPLKAATSDREEIVASEAERALKKLSKKDLKPAPQPSADSGGMSGSGLASKRNPKEVEKLQAKLQQPVVRCIVKHAQRDEEFTGVTVRFTIRPDGRAGTLQLPELTEPAPKLEACLTKLLDKVALEPAAGGNMIVSWPMMLSP